MSSTAAPKRSPDDPPVPVHPLLSSRCPAVHGHAFACVGGGDGGGTASEVRPLAPAHTAGEHPGDYPHRRLRLPQNGRARPLVVRRSRRDVRDEPRSGAVHLFPRTGANARPAGAAAPPRRADDGYGSRGSATRIGHLDPVRRPARILERHAVHLLDPPPSRLRRGVRLARPPRCLPAATTAVDGRAHRLRGGLTAPWTRRARPARWAQ